jgi:cell fate regulator YaaT (PSP1 superfamily)
MPTLGFKLRKSGSVLKIEEKSEVQCRSIWVVQTSRGIECGEVVPFQCGCRRFSREVNLIKLVRPANEEDLAGYRELESLERKAVELSVVKINDFKLAIKIITSEVIFDHSRLMLYYKELEKNAAKGKNFKDFLRDIGESLNIRVEGREVGLKAEAKLFGGFGICGQTLCCSSWLPKPKSITVRLVKEQDLSMNLSKFTGNCGCLMCCLSYEHQLYKDGVLGRKVEKVEEKK